MKKYLLVALLLLLSSNLCALNRDYKTDCDEDSRYQNYYYPYCLQHAPGDYPDWLSSRLVKFIPTIGPKCKNCHSKSIYLGYIDPDFRKYRAHLEQQLEHSSQYTSCNCYWPEYSLEAAKISDAAYLLFRDLISTTALSNLLDNEKEQRTFIDNPGWFLNKHGLTISCIAQQFRFSDYYHVCKDIENYAKANYSEKEAAKIKDKLEDVLEALYTKFYTLHTTCFAKHPSLGIEQEIRLMKLLVGDISDKTMTFVNAAINEQSYDVSEFIISNLRTAEIPVELENKGAKNANIFECTTSLNANSSSNSFSIQYEILLEQGSVLNDLLVYKTAINVLTQAIKLNPSNRDAYIERAMAYFETNQIALALKDYKQAKKLTIVPPLKSGVQYAAVDLYIPQHKMEFTKGLVLGTANGATVSTAEFIPSIFSCCRGILNGLWAFVLSPTEISQEMVTTAYAIGEYIASHSTFECLECVVPELRELSLTWHKIDDYARGKKIGYIIGKYGVDIFAPAAVLKSVNKVRALKRANTICTLEGCAASHAKQSKILKESHNFATKRQIIILEIANNGKIYPKHANAIPHILQEKHAWDKVVAIKKPIKAKGNIEENFKSVIDLLEKEEIMSTQYFTESVYSQGSIKSNMHTKIINGHKIEAIFEINTETNTTLIQDAWVVTK